MFHLFSSFDYSLFGHTRFRILDRKLFGTPKDSLQAIVTLKTGNRQALSSGGRSVYMVAITECTNYNVCYIYGGGGSGGGMAAPPPGRMDTIVTS